MPEKPIDSGTEGTIEGQPTSQIESESAPAELKAALQKELAPFLAKFEEIERQQKALQSDKDRGISRLEKKIDSTEKLLADWENAKKTGMTQEEFIEKKDMAERLARIEEYVSRNAPVQPVPAKADDSVLSVAKAVVKAGNIPETDPEYLAILQKSASNPVKLVEELSSLVVSRANKPTPTDAQAPAPVAGVKKETDEAALTAELRKLQIHPTKHAARIEEIEKLLGW